MQNTFKLSTLLYLAAMVVAPFILMPLSDMMRLNLNHLGLAIFTTPVLGFLAYRTFRKGHIPATAPAAAETAPVARAKPTSFRPSWIVAGVAILAVVLTGYGVRTGYLFVPGVSAPPIEGAYRDAAGSKVEFLGDGTMVITTSQSSETGRWSRLDATRLRIEPGSMSLLAQVCGYHFTSYTAFTLDNCDFRARLTRL
jgi:hypothetical protein